MPARNTNPKNPVVIYCPYAFVSNQTLLQLFKEKSEELSENEWENSESLNLTWQWITAEIEDRINNKTMSIHELSEV